MLIKSIRKYGTAPFIPCQGDEPDRQVCRRFTAGQFNGYLRYTRNMEALFQLWRQIDKAVIGPFGSGQRRDGKRDIINKGFRSAAIMLILGHPAHLRDEGM